MAPDGYSLNPVTLGFQLWQGLLDRMLSPRPPVPGEALRRPRVAIVGAGITGVTAAAHCVGHGFDVVLFEAGGAERLGGIWSQVNETSGLQIHAAMYRFHPSVRWSRGYPTRDEIVAQVRALWERYQLAGRTRFHTPVTRVHQDGDGRWVVNDDAAQHGRFDGLVAAVGTCGEPQRPHLEGVEAFGGAVCHSSELSGTSAKGKRVAIVGGGASAVEALEFARQTGAAHTTVLARSEKWIIPRNAAVDMLLALNVFGQETLLSRVPETLLRVLFYRNDLRELAPPPGRGHGLFTDTPMVNSDVLAQLRSGRAAWLRCDVERVAAAGVVVNRRGQGVPPGGPGHREEVPADLLILATGYRRPSLAFLPDDCFREPYEPPNWYLQTFPPSHPSVSAINCTYLAAIGTVGNWHIGIYTRILLMFLVDPLTRPSPAWMRRWIGMTRLLKRFAPTQAFDFFTYLELVWWFVFCVAINPFRWKWAVFVFFGVGLALPQRAVRLEADLRERAGLPDEDDRDHGRSL